MTETSTDTGLAVPGRPAISRRRSKNPLRSMMQHLTVELPPDEDNGRGSLMRRLSWRSKSRSPSAHSDASSSRGGGGDPTLCAACAVLAADMELTLTDLDRAYREARNDDPLDSAGSLVARLRGLDAGSACPLCRLFAAVRAADDADGSLTAFSSRDASYLVDATALFHASRDPGPAPTFLAVLPANNNNNNNKSVDDLTACFRRAGMILRTKPADRPPRTPDRHPGSRPRTPVSPGLPPAAHQGVWGRELGPAADMIVARDWLDFCRCNHPSRCHITTATTELSGFRLIDCLETPARVVPASLRGHQYVALSYVVGRGATDVVRDAVAVTRDLGLRYLWADGPCLDGMAAKERAQHVARVDDIFGGAVLAIVAAVSPDRGLPGVGPTGRPPQAKYRFAGTELTLVSSLADPRLAIERSAWHRLGSTYQEGLLARRRLVFTEHQMYWECDGMLCPEALELPLHHWHDVRQQRMCDFVHPGVFNSDAAGWRAWPRLADPAEEPSPMSVFRAGDRHVAVYTRRKLGRDEDSLNAFLGLTRRLERTLGQGRLGHLVGIPVWLPGRTKDLFALSTSFWHHRWRGQKDDDGDDDNGQVDCDVRPRRLAHLPSWTWAGWEGAVDFFSSVVTTSTTSSSSSPGGPKERRLISQHYVTAAQLTRDEPPTAWTYSPDVVVLEPDGSRIAYDFGATTTAAPPTSPGRYLLRVSNPLVLDRVKARVGQRGGGWIFNDMEMDVRLSLGGDGGLREYVERHARGEQMTLLWFVEEATVVLLVLQRAAAGRWERVGRARMAFAEEAREVVRRFGRLEVMLKHLPLRRLGEDVVIQ
ncbi:hypothetical protein L249_3901 [Ophiocordyceps polyrhachis-furcata BCC 54312]|uniref:Heterokaryon incompatibility domain-containing protein n=1 Tax=Ophiocordyceps polyrhachis-furcata BCC 54312 TaxID=1330021 RepID=A0A367L5S8_9HYPO|nr:hypothetical protein L249_3901 [Ophiocordyceps polyrhachis-furcata BCC 54312]